MDKDPWLFSYRAAAFEDYDSDSDHNVHKQSAESQLWSELDISSRKDTAVYKPNPFSIAKLNAIVRSSANRTLRAAPVSSKPPATPKNTGTIKDFFGARQKTVRHPKHNSIPPASVVSKTYPGSATAAPIVHQPVCPPAAISLPQKHSCLDAQNHSPSAHIIENNYAHILTESEFLDQPSTSSTHVLSSPIIVENPRSVSKPCHSLPVSIYAIQEETMKSQRSAPRMSALDSSNFLSEREHLVKAEQPIMPVAKPASRKKNVLKTPVSQMSCSRPAVSIQILPSKHPNHKVNGRESRAGASSPQNALRSTQSLLKEPSGARSRATCYDFGKNVDETWSTLQPPKKRFKPSIQHGPKDKTSSPFRIPGLDGNHFVQKTGMSSTSSARVIAFLPTPLHINDPGKKTGENAVGVFPPLSSPPSSPESRVSFDPDEETEELMFRPSSPPTSDPVQDDGDMDVPIDLEELKRRYPHVPQKVKEVELARI